MKVLKSIFSKIFVLALILGVAISFAGCKKDTNKTENVQIEATVNKSSIKSGETAQLTVTVTGSSDTSYTLQYDTSAIKISADGEISVVGCITVPPNFLSSGFPYSWPQQPMREALYSSSRKAGVR